MPEWYAGDPIRPLYISLEIDDWFDNEPRLHVPSRKFGGKSLYELIEQRLSEIRCRFKLAFTDADRVMPTAKSVWKFKIGAARLFGFFAAPEEFVIISGALKPDLLQKKETYAQHREKVLSFIKNNKLQKLVVTGGHSNVKKTTS